MQEDSIAFMTAFCKFKTRDYEVATSMLDDFRRKFDAASSSKMPKEFSP